jgi:hypothetical protein
MTNSVIPETLAAQSAALAEGQFSSVELTQHYLERINRLDGQFNSFITVCPDFALAQAADQRVLRQADFLRRAAYLSRQLRRNISQRAQHHHFSMRVHSQAAQPRDDREDRQTLPQLLQRVIVLAAPRWFGPQREARAQGQVFHAQIQT